MQKVLECFYFKVRIRSVFNEFLMFAHKWCGLLYTPFNNLLYIYISYYRSTFYFLKLLSLSFLLYQPMVVPNAPVNLPISSTSTQIVSEVLSKLLTVGITDAGMWSSIVSILNFCFVPLKLKFTS